jgi:ribose transport system substrate-binding protein
MAMLQVLQEKKITGSIKLVGFGFNLTPEIAAALENGAISGWVAQLPKDIGSKGVSTALSLLRGEPVPAIVYTDHLIITKSNLKDSRVQLLLAL